MKNSFQQYKPLKEIIIGSKEMEILRKLQSEEWQLKKQTSSQKTKRIMNINQKSKLLMN